jgi:hypothetical protein
LTGFEVGPVLRWIDGVLVTLEDEAGTVGLDSPLGLLDEDAGMVGEVLLMVVEYVQGLDRKC